MPDSDAASVICSSYRFIHDTVRRELAELDDDALNWTPGPNTNSIATLVTHLIGSEKEALTVAHGLQSERNRDSEFTMGHQSRQSLMDQLDLADRVLEKHRESLTEEDLISLRTRSRAPEPSTGLELLIWNVAHAREHLGQLLLTKQLFLQQSERDVS